MEALKPDHVIVSPRKGPKTPDLGPVAVMVSSGPDLDLLAGGMGIDRQDCFRRPMSRVYHGPSLPPGVSLTGPFVGAPYATILMEELIAWGARKIIFFGWAGAISPRVSVGDVIVAEGAHADEGTSAHYRAEGEGRRAPSDPVLTGRIRQTLEAEGIDYHAGDIWTTDAIYRETVGKVDHFRGKNALAVEMELSALFTVARFRGVSMGAVLSVSDDLSDYDWKPGFGSPDFKKSRKKVARAITALCRKLGGE